MKTYFNLWLAATLYAIASLSQAQTVIYEQDFESGATPAGWNKTQKSGSPGWLFGDDLGSYYFVIPAHTFYAASNDDADNEDASEDRLNMPALDLTPYSADTVYLTFDHVSPNQYGPSTQAVEYTTDGGNTSALLEVVATANDEWLTSTIDISGLTNHNSVIFSFRHNDNGNWGQGFAIDDVKIWVVDTTNASLDAINAPELAPQGPVSFGGSITNQGVVPITSLQVDYQVGSGPIRSISRNGLNIARYDSYDFTDFSAVNLITPGLQQIDMWIAEVNGASDEDASDDQLAGQISVLSETPEKRVVMEVYSGTWCGWCPDGTVFMENVIEANPRVIPVVYHSSDDMTPSHGETLVDVFVSAYPGGTVDRYKFENGSGPDISRGSWETAVAERLDDVVPVSVKITQYSFDPLTRLVEATVEADFVGTVSGDFRFNLLVLEDSVTGDGAGYDQTNYLDTTPGHFYEGAGDPIVGFVHNYTMRAMLGSKWGTELIPAIAQIGETYTKTYTYTLPPEFDERKISLVGYVAHHDDDLNDREILNADQVLLLPLIFKDSLESNP